MKARQALDLWRSQGLLGEDQVRELTASLEVFERDRPNRGIVVFAGLGALLVGLGILLFISSNWERMGPELRGTVLLAVYGSVVAGAWSLERRGYPRLGEALWFLATLSFGANIFFLGQIFNFTLTFWQGPLVWTLGALAMGYARRGKIYGHVAVPLALLCLGWLGGGAGWFMDDQFEFLFKDTGLRPIFPLVGLGLVALALLLRRWPAWSFVVPAMQAWGALLIAAPLVVATAYDKVVGEMFDTAWTVKQMAISAGSVAAIAVALGVGAVRKVEGRLLLAALALVSLALTVSPEGSSVAGDGIARYGLLFLLLVAVVFGLALLTVRLGLRASRKSLINLGMGCLAVLILIQYFSWTFELLARSLAFIAGGLMLMAIAFFMERARRRLLARLDTAGGHAG